MNDNPTEPTDEEEGEAHIIRDIDIEKEQFMRGFFARQHDIHRQSLAMVANLAQANTELILANGLAEVAAKRASKITHGTVNVVSDSLLAQRAKREETTTAAIDKLRAAITTNVHQE